VDVRTRIATRIIAIPLYGDELFLRAAKNGPCSKISKVGLRKPDVLLPIVADSLNSGSVQGARNTAHSAI
jgi:hypothetical protein